MTEYVAKLDGFDDAQQNIFGWAMVSVRKDGTAVEDHQGDRIVIDELEATAYEFVLDARASGDMHDGGPVRGQLVESVVFTPEKLAKMGIPEGSVHQGWWVGFHVPSAEDYARVKKSRLMFSIEGTAIREPV